MIDYIKLTADQHTGIVERDATEEEKARPYFLKYQVWVDGKIVRAYENRQEAEAAIDFFKELDNE